MADANEKPRDDFKRVCDLEYTINKTRDALRVITHGLEDLAESHAELDRRTLTKEDISTLYGTIALLDYVSGECDRAFWEGGHE